MKTKHFANKIITLTLFILAGMVTKSQNESTGSVITWQEARDILVAHNKYRNDVHIDSLQWSSALAAEAQAWAENLAKKGCKFYHSKTTNGENLFWSSDESTGKEAVDSWGEEIKYYHGGKIIASKVPKYGHYTQMVWEKTKYVGGGKAICKDGSVIWVCHYSPAGNIISQYPYKRR